MTVPGNMGKDVPKGTLKSVLKQAGLIESMRDKRMDYVVIYEKGDSSYGAYVPDLPGCITVGETLEEVQTLIQEAIEFHIEGLQEDGDDVPQPSLNILCSV